MSVSGVCDVHVDGRHALPEDGHNRGVEVGPEEAVARADRRQRLNTKQEAPEVSQIVKVSK